jgi:hypothetical protein
LVYVDEEATEQVATERSGDAPAMEEVEGIMAYPFIALGFKILSSSRKF